MVSCVIVEWLLDVMQSEHYELQRDLLQRDRDNAQQWEDTAAGIPYTERRDGQSGWCFVLMPDASQGEADIQQAAMHLRRNHNVSNIYFVRIFGNISKGIACAR
jgi:hypothetical protein